MFDSFFSEIAKDPIWTTVGLAGQATFLGRFVIQWLASELKKMSYIPISFWYFSLVGSFILLVYSIHRKEPVFILGFSVNSLIYLRNLHLISRKTKAERNTAAKENKK